MNEKHKQVEILKFQKEEQLLSKLKDKIDKRASFKNLAVFDADGTLWPEDANNILLKYQIKKGLRDLKDLLKPLYRNEGNRYRRCELFVERQAGLKLQEFKFYCLEALKESPLHIFPFQKELLKYLKQKDMKIFVVTASIKWLVESAVKLYDLPVDKVLGVETRLEGETIGAELLRPAPIAEFKGEVFLKHSQEETCFLAGGNTFSDLPLLKMAEVPFVVHSASRDNENFPAEEKLKKLAIKNNWIIFQNEENF